MRVFQFSPSLRPGLDAERQANEKHCDGDAVDLSHDDISFQMSEVISAWAQNDVHHPTAFWASMSQPGGKIKRCLPFTFRSNPEAGSFELFQIKVLPEGIDGFVPPPSLNASSEAM